MVLRAATGQKFVDYFDDKLWSQIGAEDSAVFITDRTQEPMVLGGMNIRTRDFARFGKLYLDEGVWNGKQVVPAQWVYDSTNPDAPHLIPGERVNSDLTLGYGYQKAGVVIVKNSANIDFMANEFESTIETVEVFRSIVSSME
jgi:hypothetical protein